MWGYGSNKIELQKIADEIVNLFDYEGNEDKNSELKIKAREALIQSSLKDLTEFGRPVHAEMAAIMSCARNGISLRGATLYCSTFPCHTVSYLVAMFKVICCNRVVLLRNRYHLVFE